MTCIFAHRGASFHCPENTMAAFLKARQFGADGIELDVQLSKDGVPVVIHDYTLHRTTNGYGNVNAKTVIELKQLDAGSWFSSEYHNETIPTLNEVLRWAKHTNLLINIELKSRGLQSNLEKRVCELVLKHQLANRVFISSFWKSSLKTVKQICPNLSTALLVEQPTQKTISLAKELKVDAIHPNYRYVTKAFVQEIKRHQLQIRPYTVNEKMKIASFCKWNVDGIITDRPDFGVSLCK